MATATEPRTAKNRLWVLRKKAPLTQQELADALGVNYRIVGKWETGEARPRPANLRRLAEVLGVTPGEVLAALDQPAE